VKRALFAYLNHARICSHYQPVLLALYIIDYKFHFMYQRQHMYTMPLTPSLRNMFINTVFIK